jgi:hypothetical protein
MGRIDTQDRRGLPATLVDTLDRAINARRWAPSLRLVLVVSAVVLPLLGALVLIVMSVSPYLAAILGTLAGAGLLGGAQRWRRPPRGRGSSIAIPTQRPAPPVPKRRGR